MARTAASDPLKTFRFWVLISGYPGAGFRTCTVPELTTEVVPYREGGDNTLPQKSDGGSDSSDITLTRGVRPRDAANPGGGLFYDWVKKVYDRKSGGGSPGTSQPGELSYDVRRDLSIVCLDRRFQPKQTINVFDAWPNRVKFSTDLDAGDTTGIVYEELGLANEGFDIDNVSTTPGLISASDAALGISVSAGV